MSEAVVNAHARLSPSNHRWPHCAGSLREEARYPDVSGDAAIDGTGTHLLVELCLFDGVSADAYIGETIGVGDKDKPEGWTVEKDRADRAQICLNYVERRCNELETQFPNAHIKVEAESRSDPGLLYGRHDWEGTCDITITVFGNNKPGLLFIETCDYKDGRGWVDEKDNSQLLAYLAGKMRLYIANDPLTPKPFRLERIGGCRMSIVQPKTSRPIRYQDCTAAEAMAKVDELAIAAAATDDPNAPLTAGKHCQWCKANPKRGGHCTAAAEQSLEVVKSMSSDLIVKEGGSLFEVIGSMVADVKALSVEQLAQLADAKPALIAAFGKAEEEIQSRIEAGTAVPGYAMLPGNSSYVWGGTKEEIEKALKGRRLKLKDIYPPKLISPAQMKKLPNDILSPEQKKRLEKDFVTEKTGKLTLKKVALKEKASSEELFADVPKNTVAEAAPVSFL
ncbi:DUF2800 domain-containing protein [Flavobacteriales bacterium]|nr:DUF2800 domain-containing protein [Flavobacteriales bacterium]